MRYLILAFLFASFSYCKGQTTTPYSGKLVPYSGSTTLDKFGTPLQWDSAYLRHYVDSTGTIPSGVDLRSLHLGTTVIKNDVIDSSNFYFLVAFLLTKIEAQRKEIEYYKENLDLSDRTVKTQKDIIRMLKEMLPDEQLKKIQ